MSYDNIDNQLWELQKACNRYAAVDPLAPWVLNAVTRYIVTDRATKQFLHDFCAYPVADLEELIRKALNGDRSDDGILKSVKREISGKSA